MKIKRLLTAFILAVAAMTIAGCSADVTLDEKTGVVDINGVPINKVIALLGLDYSYEVSFDPETGIISINDTAVSSLEDIQDMHLSMTLPEEFDDILGVVEQDGAQVGPDSGIFMTENLYYGVSKEWMESFEDISDLTDEAQKKINGSMMKLPSVWSAKRTTSVPEIVENAAKNDINVNSDDFTKVGEAGEYYFYRYFEKDQENEKNLDPDFKEEYDKLCRLMRDAIEDARFFEPSSD